MFFSTRKLKPIALIGSLLFPVAVLAFDFGNLAKDLGDKIADKAVQSATQTISDSITSALPPIAKDAVEETLGTVDIDQGVVVFGYDGCPHCRNTYSYLRGKQVSYRKLDVEKSKSARRMASAEGLRGFPVIYIEGSKIVGFNKNKINSLLKQNNIL